MDGGFRRPFPSNHAGYETYRWNQFLDLDSIHFELHLPTRLPSSASLKSKDENKVQGFVEGGWIHIPTTFLHAPTHLSPISPLPIPSVLAATFEALYQNMPNIRFGFSEEQTHELRIWAGGLVGVIMSGADDKEFFNACWVWWCNKYGVPNVGPLLEYDLQNDYNVRRAVRSFQSPYSHVLM